MRTTKEVLQMLLERIKDKPYIDFGLCRELDRLEHDGLMTYKEWLICNAYIKINMPQDFDGGYGVGVYGWPKTEVAPRVAWLKEQIAKL